MFLPRRIGKNTCVLAFACTLSFFQRVVISVNDKRTYEFAKHFIEKCPCTVRSNLELRIDHRDDDPLYSRSIGVFIEFRKLVTESD